MTRPLWPLCFALERIASRMQWLRSLKSCDHSCRDFSTSLAPVYAPAGVGRHTATHMLSPMGSMMTVHDTPAPVQQ